VTDAHEIAARSAMIKTAHMTMQMTIMMTATQSAKSAPSTPVALKISIDGENDVVFSATPKENRAHMALKTTLLGTELKSETIIAYGRQWTRVADEPWQENTRYRKSTAAQSDFMSNPTASLAYLGLIKDAYWLADEVVDGVPTRHIGFTLDVGKMPSAPAIIEQLYDSEMSPEDLAQLLRDGTFEGEMWVGTADQLVRKQRIHIKLLLKSLPDMPPDTQATADITLINKLSKINEPVTIQPPLNQEF